MDLNQFKFFIKRPVHGPKKTDKTSFHRSGPVFLSSRTKEDRSQSRSFNFGPKNRTGPDLRTLPKIEGPRPGPVHLYLRTQKDRTGPMKTGLNISKLGSGYRLLCNGL